MDKQIVIGKIVAPHGVRGEFRILPQTEHPEQFLSLKYLLLPGGRRLDLESARFHKNMVLAKAGGINDMDAAERLRGLSVSIFKEDLPPLEEGRFYVSDLIGLAVLDGDGRRIGALADVYPTGSNDVFAVRTEEGREILIPAIETHIKEINISEGLIRVVLPEWAD